MRLLDTTVGPSYHGCGQGAQHGAATLVTQQQQKASVQDTMIFGILNLKRPILCKRKNCSFLSS